MTPPPRLLDVRAVRILYAGVAALLLVNAVNELLGTPFWTITKLIHLGSDRNASAWYSSVLLFAAAGVAFQCGRLALERRIEGHRVLFLVAALLLLMSCDEIARLHEEFGAVVANRVGIGDRSFAQHARWVWVLGPVVIAVFGAVILLTLRTLRRVPASVRPFVGGFGLIVLGGVLLESTINFLNHDELEWVWRIEIIVEEGLEMIGTMWILMALVHWRDGTERATAPTRLAAAASSVATAAGESPQKASSRPRLTGGPTRAQEPTAHER